MHCPVCSMSALARHEVEAQLFSHQCPSCGGQWISGERYRAWQAKHKSSLPETDSNASSLSIAESDKPKRCPECAHLLLPYPVGHGLAFVLDHCGHCGGTWFDKNEWEAIKREGLANDVQSIFTSVWQAHLRREARLRAFEERQTEKFGAEEWAEARRIKAWIDAHPHKTEILAYLLHGEIIETRSPA